MCGGGGGSCCEGGCLLMSGKEIMTYMDAIGFSFLSVYLN